MTKSSTKTTFDYDYWCLLPLWPLDCAVWLALGKDPNHTMNTREALEKRKEWHIAVSAYKAEKIKHVEGIKGEVRPEDFLPWVMSIKEKNKELFRNFPAELEILLPESKPSKALDKELNTNAKTTLLVLLDLALGSKPINNRDTAAAKKLEVEGDTRGLPITWRTIYKYFKEIPDAIERRLK